MAGAFPHAKGEKVYYVRRLGHTTYLPKLGADGKPIIKSNPVTGNPIMKANGEPEFIEIPIEFTKWKTKFSVDGYVCIYVVKADTDKRIADLLAAEAKDRGSEIMDEKTYIKTVNPELAQKMEDDEKNSAIISDLSDKNKALIAEVEGLKKRLGGRN